MSQEILRDFAYRLGFEIDDRDLTKLNDGLNKIEKGWSGVTDAARRTAAEIGIAVGLAGAAVGKAVLDTADLGDETAKTARKLGVGVEELQELRFAADRSRVSQEALTVALQRGARNFDDFRKGSGEAKAALEGLGVTSDQIVGPDGSLLPMPELLNLTADALQGATSDTERLALAQRILGRGGAELIPLLAAGSEGINGLRMEAREFGQILDAEAAAGAEELTDRLTDLRAIATGLRNQIGAALLPVVNDLTSGVIRWFRSNQLVIRQRLDRFAEVIGAALRRFGVIVTDVDEIVRKRLGGWTRVFSALSAGLAGFYALIVGARFAGPLATLASGIATVVAGLLGVSAGMAGIIIAAAALKLTVIAGQIAAVVLFVDDLNTFLREGDSILGRWIEQLAASGDEGWALAELLTELLLLLGSVGDAAGEMAGLFGEQLLFSLNAASEAFSRLLGLMRQGLDLALQLVGTDVAGVFSMLAGVVRGARGGVESTEQRFAASRARVAATRAVQEDVGTRAALLGPRPSGQPAQVSVNVDARGREAPGQTGAEVGFSVERALRSAAAFGGG